MVFKLLRRRQKSVKRARQYFKDEIGRIPVPQPPPVLPALNTTRGKRFGTKQLVAAAAFAGAIGLLLLTAGKQTLLSQGIESTFTRYNVHAEINAFLYKSQVNGG